jgi:hypothetical protein
VANADEALDAKSMVYEMLPLEGDVISDLRSLLNDQYDEQSILKELIQNAEDAKGCTQLHLGWMSDWPEGAHPLLAGPTLVVLNDGLFERADAEAIRRLKRGTKGGESRFIGKFGVGLKSVFHLCEAFFFAASPAQPGSSGSTSFGGVNPWGQTKVHPDWHDVSGARSAVIERLDAWDHDCGRWFCLALPLRTESQLGGKEPLRRASPQYTDFLNDRLPDRIAAAAILLRHLTRVCLWDWDAEHSRMEMRHVVEVGPGHERCREFDRMQRDARLPLHGAVYLNRAGEERAAPHLRYAGAEVLLADPEFVRLKADREWPHIDVTNPKTGGQDYVRLGAEPHAAVVFSARPAATPGTGTLRVIHATFLPLSGEGRGVGAVGGDTDYVVTLHGDFFVETGRRVIQDFRPDDNSPKALWQRRLWERGAWPLVLPALEQFVVRTGVEQEQVVQLTDALAEFIKAEDRGLGHVCRDSQWLACLDPEGTAKWQLAPIGSEYLELPDPAAAQAINPTLVFPALKELAGSLLITTDRMCGITSRSRSSWAEHREGLLELVGSVPDQVFTQPDLLEYATRLLDYLRQDHGDVLRAAREEFRKRTGEAVVKLGWPAMQRNEAAFGRFLRALGTAQWARVAVREEDVPVVRRMCELALEHLPVPAHVAGDVPSGQFTANDCRAILDWLASSEDIAPERKNAVALSVLKSAEPAAGSLREKCGSHKVFLARKLDEAAEQLLSWDKLAELHELGRLYLPRSPFAGLLRAAIRDLDLWTPVATEVFQVLFDFKEGPSLDKAACFAILRTKPTLHPALKRVGLLESLLGRPDSVSESDYRACLRYLLHGSREHFADTGVPLVTTAGAGETPDAVVGRVAKEALERRQQNWRWVPPELADRLTREQERAMGVQRLRAQTLEEMLAESGVGWLAGLSLTTDERLSLLRLIDSDDLWRRLPLHETVTGALVPATDTRSGSPCYLEPELSYPVPAALRSILPIIRRPADVALVHRYRTIGLEEWGPLGLLREICGHMEPHRFCFDVLDALCRIAEDRAASPPNLPPELRDREWLLGHDGAPRKPSDVIYLPGLEDDLARLLGRPDIGGAYLCVLQLPDKIREHAGFELVAKWLLPGEPQALETLGACLQGIDEFRLGRVRELDRDPEALANFLRAVRVPALDAVLPVVPLLANVVDKLGPELACRHLLPELLSPIAVPRTRDVLLALAARHAQGATADGKACLEVHHWYLRSLVNADGFDREHLRGLKLLNRNDHWQDVEKLCLEASGVDAAYLVGKRQADLIRGHSTVTDSGSAHSRPAVRGKECGVQDLLEYFGRWEGRVPYPAIGALLALLGPEFREAAADYLKTRSRSLDELIRRLGRPVGRGPLHREDRLDASDLPAKINSQRFQLRLAAQGAPVAVLNVVGEPFEAPMAASPHNLLVGSTHRDRGPGRGSRTLVFVDLSPGDFSGGSPSELLRETAGDLLRDVYNHDNGSLLTLWRELTETGQVELECSQRLILDSAFFYFQQLGGPVHPKLRALFQRWESLREEQAELDLVPGQKRTTDISRVAGDFTALQADLGRLLEQDPEVQHGVLDAVRRRMQEHYQYSASAIPFELFQNADDAATEWATGDGEQPANLDYVEIHYTNDELLWTHWGRPVNDPRAGRASSEEGRSQGYHRDLDKMLIMGGTSKPQRVEPVTGKYGLGFKSVLLLADRPKVLSAELGFEVVAGFFPKHLDKGERDRLQRFVQDPQSGRVDGTVIELPVREDREVSPVEAMERFCRLVPLCLVFARKVKRCRLQTTSPQVTSLQWQETAVTGCAQVFTGALDLSSVDLATNESIVVLRSPGGTGALLLRVGSHKFENLPAEVPTLWVTAPTQERSNVGFAVNGEFALDVGRAQLAKDADENGRVANRLGRDFGAALCQLFDASQDRAAFTHALNLAADSSDYDLWWSLWEILANQLQLVRPNVASTPTGRLLQQMLWGDDCGMRRLVTERRALPTGLRGGHRCLTDMGSVRWVAEGILDRDEDVFLAVSHWERVQRRLQPGQVVSQSRVAAKLRDLTGEEHQWQPLTLQSTIEWQLSTAPQVSTDEAGVLGKVITQELLNKLQQGSMADQRECVQLRESLDRLQFRTKDGTPRSPRELLVASAHGDDGDEALRAAFAPDARLLDESYQDEALAFFLVCREQLHAPAPLLARWGLEVTDAAKRDAFLRYVVDGRLSREVAAEARSGKRGTWLESVHESPACARTFGEPDWLVLLGHLGLGRTQAAWTPPVVVPAAPSREILRHLHDWWGEHGAAELARYETRLYPGGRFPNVHPEAPADDEERVEWLKLFLLGVLQTLGRTTDEKNRRFVQQCDERGWLAAMAQSDAAPEKWVQLWDDYVETQDLDLSYFQWMKQLLGLFVIGRRLDKYVEVFLAVNRLEGRFDLSQITTPRASDIFSGGGPDAPPVARILGVGACFVMRELCRKGIITNPEAHRYCYVPLSRVRRLVHRLGGPNLDAQQHDRWERSSLIYDFLREHLRGKDVTFGRAFDIPFQIVEMDDDLWSGFFEGSREEVAPEEEEL